MPQTAGIVPTISRRKPAGAAAVHGFLQRAMQIDPGIAVVIAPVSSLADFEPRMTGWELLSRPKLNEQLRPHFEMRGQFFSRLSCVSRFKSGFGPFSLARIPLF
jgi:hypothetical protein